MTTKNTIKKTKIKAVERRKLDFSLTGGTKDKGVRAGWFALLGLFVVVMCIATLRVGENMTDTAMRRQQANGACKWEMSSNDLEPGAYGCQVVMQGDAITDVQIENLGK